jgi:hypothetical protein
MKQLSRTLQALEGRRVELDTPCVYCWARQGVLLFHCARDELELYCDGCERWRGVRLTDADVKAWTAQTAWPSQRLLSVSA